MNQVFNYTASLSQNLYSVFTERVLPELTAQHRRVLVMSSIAVGALAACVLAYRYYCNSNSPSSPPNTPQVVPVKFPPPIYNFPSPKAPRFSPKAPKFSPNISPIMTPQQFGGIGGLLVQNQLGQQGLSQPGIIVKPSAGTPKKNIPKTDLEILEGQIDKITEDLNVERQTLALLKENQDPFLDFIEQEEDEKSLSFATKEQEIRELEGDLKTHLEDYPTTFCQYLRDKFTNHHNPNFQDVYSHLAKFSGYMDSNADEEAFIQDCLTQVDEFLTQTFFTSPSESCLQEQQKVNLMVFHEFFAICNKYFPVIENTQPQLALKLKVKLANLPLRSDVNREDFKNIYLTEQDQLRILTNHFQDEENTHIQTVIRRLQSLSKKANIYEGDITKLSKLICNKQSPLSATNRQALQQALLQVMGLQAQPASWNDHDHTRIKQELKLYFKSTPYYYGSSLNEILDLHRASKAKQYFVRQDGFNEDEIQIPRWYHATHYPTVTLIINSGVIRVMHKQAYNGAWVSSQRETSMGDCVFVFNHRITQIDPNVFIGYEHGKVLWRGLQKEIPLVGSNTVSNVHLVGYRKTGLNVKDEKRRILQDLSNPKVQLKRVTVVSVEQIDYLQKETLKVIGNPNLTEQWWGKADITKLDTVI